jgi:hypothetical protein
VDLYIHSPIRLHGAVLDSFTTGRTFPLSFMGDGFMFTRTRFMLYSCYAFFSSREFSHSLNPVSFVITYICVYFPRAFLFVYFEKVDSKSDHQTVSVSLSVKLTPNYGTELVRTQYDRPTLKFVRPFCW